MATKKEIAECINLIEFMKVQVNYRGKRFLNASGLSKGNKQYSFYEIIINIPEEEREKLEKSYISRKNKYAKEADVKMLQYIPDAKEQIADAFIPFIDEVQSELNKLISENNEEIANWYLTRKTVWSKLDGKEIKRYNHGLHLVYKDMKSRCAHYTNKLPTFKGEMLDYESVPSESEYSFDALPKLLDVIAKITTDYCKKADEEQKIDRSEVLVGEGKLGQVTPLFIRQTCAWVCYTLLYFGDTISKFFLQEPLTHRSGVCSQIMHDLHLRTRLSYGYDYFSKEKKLFSYNKWSIIPEVILRVGNFIAPVSPVSYAGHKSGYLGYMLQSLVDQRIFDTYLEPFGGSGIGITQFHKKEGVKYYISAANYSNICFYKVLMNDNFSNNFLKN